LIIIGIKLLRGVKPGIEYRKISYYDFKILITGQDLNTTRNIFKLDWNNLNIKLITEKVIIKHRANILSECKNSNSNKKVNKNCEP